MKYTTQTLADLFAQLVAGRLAKHNADIRFLNEHPAFASKLRLLVGHRVIKGEGACDACDVDEHLIEMANLLTDSLVKRSPSVICLPPSADKYQANGICANVAVGVYACPPYDYETDDELTTIWHAVSIYYL